MNDSDADAHGDLAPESEPRVLRGDAERLEWWRIHEACAESRPAAFTYSHLWMAWACWIRAEEYDPQPVQCSKGRCICFTEGAAIEHWRGQRDAFETDGVSPRNGFAPPASDGRCPPGRESDFTELDALFGASILGSDGPLNVPGRHAIRHPAGCDASGCVADATGERHAWFVEPDLQRPSTGNRSTTVTIDWSWSNTQIIDAVKRLRDLVGTPSFARRSGPPFWHRYGPERTISLLDLAESGESIRAWAAEEARQTGKDPESERVEAQRVLKNTRSAIDAAGRGDLNPVLGW